MGDPGQECRESTEVSDTGAGGLLKHTSYPHLWVILEVVRVLEGSEQGLWAL